jgi:hypothetical protein
MRVQRYQLQVCSVQGETRRVKPSNGSQKNWLFRTASLAAALAAQLAQPLSATAKLSLLLAIRFSRPHFSWLTSLQQSQLHS